MSLFPQETVQIYAESIGIPRLKEDVCVTLAQEVEYRCRELIQQAEKFMLHARRSKLTIEDVNCALRLRHAEPLYGFDASEPLNFRLVPHTSLFFCQDPELDLDAFLATPLPRAPLASHFSAHWLAIEGVQPSIPENPPVAERTFLAIPDTKEPENKALLVTSRKDISLIQEDAEVTPCVKHILSKEMQLFYDTIVSCIASPKEEERACAFESLRSDAGLQQLLPYLIQYAAENIARSLRAPAILHCMIELCSCLVANPHLFLEPYLHQLMPMLLSCVLAKPAAAAAAAAPSPDSAVNSGITPTHSRVIREKAAGVVAFICKKFGNAYQTLYLRIVKTLLKTIGDRGRPLSSHYGAFYCLGQLGGETVRQAIFPLLPDYTVWLAHGQRFSLSEPACREVEAVHQLLICICRTAVKEGGSSVAEDAALFERCFGDDFLLTDV